MAERRKKGNRASFYKKACDLTSSNNSSALLSHHKMPTSSNTKEVSLEQQSLEPADNEPEEMHYRMVGFQHRCKKMVTN